MLGTTFRFLIIVLTVMAVAYLLSFYGPVELEDSELSKTAQTTSN